MSYKVGDIVRVVHSSIRHGSVGEVVHIHVPAGASHETYVVQFLFGRYAGTRANYGCPESLELITQEPSND